MFFIYLRKFYLFILNRCRFTMTANIWLAATQRPRKLRQAIFVVRK